MNEKPEFKFFTEFCGEVTLYRSKDEFRTDEAAEKALEEFCAWCGEPADPVLLPGAGLGWCGCGLDVDEENNCE